MKIKTDIGTLKETEDVIVSSCSVASHLPYGHIPPMENHNQIVKPMLAEPPGLYNPALQCNLQVIWGVCLLIKVKLTVSPLSGCSWLGRFVLHRAAPQQGTDRTPARGCPCVDDTRTRRAAEMLHVPFFSLSLFLFNLRGWLLVLKVSQHSYNRQQFTSVISRLRNTQRQFNLLQQVVGPEQCTINTFVLIVSPLCKNKLLVNESIWRIDWIIIWFPAHIHAWVQPRPGRIDQAGCQRRLPARRPDADTLMCLFNS